MPKYHKSPLKGRAMPCEATEGNCPYCAEGTPLSKRGTPLVGGITMKEDWDNHVESNRKVRLSEARSRQELYAQEEERLVRTFFTADEQRMYYANKALYAYDNGRGQDDETNNQLYYLSQAHPEAYYRLSQGFDNLSTVAQRKAAIKRCYDFHKKYPTGIYRSFPRLKEEAVRSTPVAPDGTANLFYYADTSGDITLQGRLEYLYREHPKEFEALGRRRGEVKTDYAFEKLINERYKALKKTDDEVAEEEARFRHLQGKKSYVNSIQAKEHTSSFKKVAKTLASLFRRMAMKRPYLKDGQAQPKKASAPLGGDVVATRWVADGGGYLLHEDPQPSRLKKLMVEVKVLLHAPTEEEQGGKPGKV